MVFYFDLKFYFLEKSYLKKKEKKLDNEDIYLNKVELKVL
jgi:hypothetical protein